MVKVVSGKSSEGKMIIIQNRDQNHKYVKLELDTKVKTTK